jgi:hypothetical protein
LTTARNEVDISPLLRLLRDHVPPEEARELLTAEQRGGPLSVSFNREGDIPNACVWADGSVYFRTRHYRGAKGPRMQRDFVEVVETPLEYR